MFVNKRIFEDETSDAQSEPIPPNQVDTCSTISVDGRKNKMKDLLAEQRALAMKKKEARNVGSIAAPAVKMVSGNDGPAQQSKKSAFVVDQSSYNEDASNKVSSEENRSEMEMVEPIFDPAMSKRVPITPDVADPNAVDNDYDFDIKDMNKFIHSPPPGPLQCYIIRQRGGLKNRLYPKYELYLKHGDRFVLAAKKRTNNKSSNYLISKDTNDLSKSSANYLGKLRSNFVGTEFLVFDDGVKVKPSEKGLPPSISRTPGTRKELGCIFYQSNILGSRGPRKMTVLIPSLSNNEPTDLAESFKSGEHLTSNKIFCLENKSPKWSEPVSMTIFMIEVGAYVLNFNGRVTMASVKNFQLIQTGMSGSFSAGGGSASSSSGSASQNDAVVIMQFGRVAKDNFTMDIRAPLTPLQAFAIALSSFDYKLACE